MIARARIRRAVLKKEISHEMLKMFVFKVFAVFIMFKILQVFSWLCLSYSRPC